MNVHIAWQYSHPARHYQADQPSGSELELGIFPSSASNDCPKIHASTLMQPVHYEDQRLSSFRLDVRSGTLAHDYSILLSNTLEIAIQLVRALSLRSASSIASCYVEVALAVMDHYHLIFDPRRMIR